MVRGWVRASALIVVVTVATACTTTATSPTSLKGAIQRGALRAGHLCTWYLPLPDTTPAGATRQAFEDEMVQIGAFRRVRHFVKDGRRLTVYDFASHPLAGTIFGARPTKTAPAVVRICFGTVRLARILSVVPSSSHINGEMKVTFAYTVDVFQWAQPLRSYLRLTNGTGYAYVEAYSGREATTYQVWPPFDPDLPFKRALYPPKGSNWYLTDGVPPALRRVTHPPYPV